MGTNCGEDSKNEPVEIIMIPETTIKHIVRTRKMVFQNSFFKKETK